MHMIILSALIVVSSGAKLDNKYLPPPPGAKDAGGNEDNLQLPLEPPYVDPYSGNEPKYSYGAPSSRGKPTSRDHYNQPNQYGRNLDFDRVNNVQYKGGDSIENEDEIRNVQDSSFRRSKSRFLGGSYSYTGPDNVLVTVTYSADNKRQGRKYGDRDQDEDSGYTRGLDHTIIPTPPSLPSELQKAFDFHKKKYQPQDDRDGKGYQYNKPQPSKGRSDKPQIDQGYSYPRPEQQ